MHGRLGGSLLWMLGLSGVSFTLFEACSLNASGLPGGVGSGGGGASVTSSASGPNERCGDAKLSMSEACDDGNTAPGDGCSPTCAIEQPDTCPGVAVPLDPTGITLQGDLTDRKDDLHPGCATMDGGDVIYAVTPTATGTLTVTLSGDAAFRRSLSIRSICASDIPATEISCGAGETADPIVLRAWVIQGMTYHVIIDGEPHAFSLSLGLNPCGDGKREELEQCDGEQDCKGCVTCTGPGEFWAPTTARCYRFVDAPATWVDARKDCVTWGGDLAGIATQVELTEVGKHPFNSAPFLWTGGYALSPRCAFMWSDSEPWSQEGWRIGEPDDTETPANCVALALPPSGPYQMIDDACSKAFPYLCERSPANVCGDGTLQPGEQCDDAIGPPGKCNQCRVQCLEGEFQDPFTYHCYRQIGGENIKDWIDARMACHESNSQLATISSAEENALVASHLDGDAWLGGTWSFTQGELWDNGERFCFRSWGASQPVLGSGDCIALRPDGTWANEGCGKHKGFVCERGP